MLPVSRQHVSLCIQQQTGNKLAIILLPAMLLVAGNMLLALKQHSRRQVLHNETSTVEVGLQVRLKQQCE